MNIEAHKTEVVINKLKHMPLPLVGLRLQSVTNWEDCLIS